MDLLFLVDVANLFYSVREMFGDKARVDFKKLKEAAIAGRSFDRVIAVAFYATKEGQPSPDPFLDALRKVGYDVELVPVTSGVSGSVDVSLAVEALALGRKANTVVVASGDSDFIPVYKRLKSGGVRVEVMAFPTSLSGAVKDVVDSLVYLSRELLFDNHEHLEGV